MQADTEISSSRESHWFACRWIPQESYIEGQDSLVCEGSECVVVSQEYAVYRQQSETAENGITNMVVKI